MRTNILADICISVPLKQNKMSFYKGAFEFNNKKRHYGWKKCEFSWWEGNKKISIKNYRVYTLKTSGKNYIETHNFRVSFDEKTTSNLKLLKETIL